MADALLGYTGFVGESLQRQRTFDARFRSTDIEGIHHKEFDLIVCAAAASQKWLANLRPAEDRTNIQRLFKSLALVRGRKFVLISTVDVLNSPLGVDESASVDLDSLEPYGRHRRELELFVQDRFPSVLIARLPALVGPRLRKNALHDLVHGHETEKIDSRGQFQFYPIVNLWTDLRRALELQLEVVHLATEPLTIAEVASEALCQTFTSVPDTARAPARYDFRSQYADKFDGSGGYLYRRRELLTALRAYVQSEAPSSAVRYASRNL